MHETPGLTVIVITYDRPRAFRAMLQSLAAQRMDGIPVELLVINNARQTRVALGGWSRTGRLLGRFADVKVLNSSHNWLCRVRYPATALARYDTVAFIDDDVELLDEGFLRSMHDTFATLRPVDILSCWTALWTDWNDQHLKKVRMNFRTPWPTRLTECDYAGPGLCIFDRRILTDSGLLRLAPELQRSDSAWFPWLTAMTVGSRKYYLPSHGRVEFHSQNQRHALMQVPGFRAQMYSAYKAMWMRGYVPVLQRKGAEPDFADSPEAEAARRLPVETDAW
jgi:hypothetical protein